MRPFVGLPSHSRMLSGLIHTVACVQASFIFYGSIAFHCMDGPHVFIHSSFGDLGCFVLFLFL